MTELYEHRYALFTALVRMLPFYDATLLFAVTAWKSRKHFDGTMFDNYFIAGISRDKSDGTTEHLTYHFPIEWWDRLKCEERETAPEWDGHSSSDVIKMLLSL